MEDLPLNKIDIFSDKETYELVIDTNFQEILELLKNTKAVIIDKNVFDLYNNDLKIQEDKIILIEALEDKKRPEYALDICEKLMHLNVKRKAGAAAPVRRRRLRGRARGPVPQPLPALLQHHLRQPGGRGGLS